MKEVTFRFGGNPVGLLARDFFGKPGRCGYRPYRGPGHLAMQTALNSEGYARCSVKDGKNELFFTVGGCPEYGVLELRDFQAT
jgi:hypothetical protein